MENLVVKVLGSDIYKAVRNYLNHDAGFQARISELLPESLESYAKKCIELEAHKFIQNYAFRQTMESAVKTELKAYIKEQVAKQVKITVTEGEK